MFQYNHGMHDSQFNYPRILPVGDTALTIEFGNMIDRAVNQKVYALEQSILANPLTGVVDLVPSYRSLLVTFNPLIADIDSCKKAFEKILSALPDRIESTAREIEIPVRYGSAEGPDLDFVAEHNGLTIREVIEIHTSRVYPIYMMGFTPGFPYLGGMDSRIAAPRLETPRTLVPAGSVGIAGEQTGVYSIESPGGWRLIGRTDLKLFDLKNEHPFLLSPGDTIRFVPVQGSMS